jgi:hypothetical protein
MARPPEADLPDFLRSLVHLVARCVNRVSRDLDDNEMRNGDPKPSRTVRKSARFECERLLAQGITLIARRNAFEFFHERVRLTANSTPGVK